MLYWNVEGYGLLNVDIAITREKNGEKLSEADVVNVLAIVEHYYKRKIEDEVIADLAKSGHLK